MPGAGVHAIVPERPTLRNREVVINEVSVSLTQERRRAQIGARPAPVPRGGHRKPKTGRALRDPERVGGTGDDNLATPAIVTKMERSGVGDVPFAAVSGFQRFEGSFTGEAGEVMLGTQAALPTPLAQDGLLWFT